MRRHLLRTVTVGLRKRGRRGERKPASAPTGRRQDRKRSTPSPYPSGGGDGGFPVPSLGETDPELAEALADYASAQREEVEAQFAFYRATGCLLDGYIDLGYGRLPQEARNALAAQEAPEQFQRHLAAQAEARVAYQRLATLNGVRNTPS